MPETATVSGVSVRFGAALLSGAVFVSRQTRMLFDSPSSVKTGRELRKYSVPFASSEY